MAQLVEVVSVAHGLDIMLPVMTLTEDLLDPASTRVTLGSSAPMISRGGSGSAQVITGGGGGGGDMSNYYTKAEVNDLLAAKQSTLTFDTTPTAGSGNPVTSSGIRAAIDAIQPGTSVDPSTTTPLMDGTAAVGAETAYARGDHRHPTDTSRAPTSHRSTGTTYGAGTASYYGHLKLSDSTSSTLGTGGGTAATPSAVKAAYDLADGAWTLAAANPTFDQIYPVGSIYMSISSTDPGTLFGGTWARIRDTFLLAAGNTYAAGATGGEAAHTLTVNEMPSHSHDLWFWNYVPAGGSTSGIGSASTHTGSSTGAIQSTGGGAAHNNMPPYLAVYMWRRTA